MEGLTAPILFQDNPDTMKQNINLLVSRYYDMKGGLCEQRPFFIGIDISSVTTYILSFN